MRHTLSLLLGTLLLAGLTLAAPETAKKPAALRCTLTGKKIETCCCEQRQGKLYCPLAKKTVEKCCCVPATDEKGKAAKSSKKG